VAFPATAGSVARAQGDAARPDAGRKVLRYAFRVAETGFDPAQVNDFSSSTVIANIFEAPLTYDFLARPAKIVPNTAVALPDVSDDFRTFTVRIRPGIHFRTTQHSRAVGASWSRRTTSTRSSGSTTRSSRPAALSAEDAQLLRMNGRSRLRAAALKGEGSTSTAKSTACARSTATSLQLRLGEPSPRFHPVPRRQFRLRRGCTRSRQDVRRQAALLGQPVGTGPFRLAMAAFVAHRARTEPGLPRRCAPQPTAGDAEGEAIAARLRGRRLPLVDRVEVYIVENQPRWLSLNSEHDLVDELPYDLANLVIPNGQLAPNLLRRDVRMDRAPRASVEVALFNMEHPVVGGYAPSRWRCAAQ